MSWRIAICFLALTGCGAPASTKDGGTDFGCSIATGGVGVSAMDMTVPGNTLSCTGSIGNTPLACTGTPTLTRTDCTDGYAFALTSGADTLYIRMQVVDANWSAGAQFEGGAPLSGSITFLGLDAPNQLPPPPGNEIASFYLEGSGTEAAVSANGTLTTNW